MNWPRLVGTVMHWMAFVVLLSALIRLLANGATQETLEDVLILSAAAAPMCLVGTLLTRPVERELEGSE
jgi:hypothetical protein